MLDRGVVAVASGNGVFVSWRMLGTEPDDVAYNVYRNGVLLNSAPLTGATNHFDAAGTTASRYTVAMVAKGVEQARSAAASVWAQPQLTVKLQRPAAGTTPDGVAYDYSPNDTAVGDVDGDGAYEFIVKWDPSNAKDNSQSGYTGNVFVDAYKLDGTRLWRIDLGRNIRAGAHYTQFIVYDLDGDGKAEVAMKTADGTVDGAGVVIGDANADHRNSTGYILRGPEFLTVFNGASGRAMATTAFVPARGTVSSWGDNYGNRVDRFLAGVAYLDGQRPSLVMSRGYYTRAVIATWDWRGGKLSNRWTFDSDTSGQSAYRGQGAHSFVVSDVNNDGKDDIVFGAAVIDSSGKGLYSTGLGHGDALHVSDFDPSRPGKEVMMVHEDAGSYGAHGVEMHDAATGRILWSLPGGGSDVGRGVAMDVDARHPGAESWASVGGLTSAKGVQISVNRPPRINFGVYWDGDLLRELLDGTTIDKWNPATEKLDRLVTGYNAGAASNNSTKSTPALSADIFGDWREEVIWRNANNSELLVFTTTIPTAERLRTLVHDTQYRVAIANQNSAYNQPPATSFFLGAGMSKPPQPKVYVAAGATSTSTPAPTPTPAPNPAPASTALWSNVAGEGQALTVNGTVRVRYGHGTSWVEKTVNGTGQCNDAFFGADPAASQVKVCQVVVASLPTTTKVYIAGDSTVMSYRANYYPQQGWGARLPGYFSQNVSFANHAIGGRSSKSFITEGRLATILGQIRPNDYLFVQFGHNDQGASNVESRTVAATTYKEYLRQYADGARSRGAIPVFVTPMARLSHDAAGKFRNSFGAYTTAMKEVAAEKAVPVIDLSAKSVAYLDSIGVAAAKGVFLWLAAGQYPNFPNGLSDSTHFQEAGADQMARLVAQGVREQKLAMLSANLVK